MFVEFVFGEVRVVAAKGIVLHENVFVPLIDTVKQEDGVGCTLEESSTKLGEVPELGPVAPAETASSRQIAESFSSIGVFDVPPISILKQMVMDHKWL